MRCPEIWHVRADDGSDGRNATNHPGNDIRPAWSPDGASIAFESHRDGNAEIYLVDIDAPPSSAVNLTRDMFEDVDPSWSPDGSRIAFVSDRDLLVWQIWSMDRSGSGATVAPGTEPGDREPAFSPDGMALAFTRNGNDGVEGIWRVSLDGTGLALLNAASPFTRSADWQGIAAEPENGPPSAHPGPDGRVECVGHEREIRFEVGIVQGRRHWRQVEIKRVAFHIYKPLQRCGNIISGQIINVDRCVWSNWCYGYL